MFKSIASTALLGTLTIINAAPSIAATAEFDGDMSPRCDLTANNTGTLVKDGFDLTTEGVGGEAVEVTADVLGNAFRIRTGGDSFTSSVDGTSYSNTAASFKWNGGNSLPLRSYTGASLGNSDKSVSGSETLELDLVVGAQTSGSGLNKQFVTGQYNATLTLTCIN